MTHILKESIITKADAESANSLIDHLIKINVIESINIYKCLKCFRFMVIIQFSNMEKRFIYSYDVVNYLHHKNNLLSFANSKHLNKGICKKCKSKEL